MSMYKVFCNEKKGYWRVLASTEEEAIYEATKGRGCYTGVYAMEIN